MFKKIAEAVVCGAIGVAALYVVGRVAYQAGREMGHEESRYQAMQHKERKIEKQKSVSKAPEQPVEETALAVVDEPEIVTLPKKKPSKLGMLLGMGRMFGGKKTVIGNLVRDPEGHKFEAYVEGDELQIHVRRKEAS